MMFIDGPSLFAPIEKWEAYLLSLNKLQPHDDTVVSEKKRAAKIIEILKEPASVDSGTDAALDRILDLERFQCERNSRETFAVY